MDLRLLVLRTNKPETLVEFYSLFGLSFDHHKHGNSPYHYSAMMAQLVFEIYPLAKGQTESDNNLRLGFAIDRFDEITNKLKSLNIKFFMDPIETDFGFMAIVADPDGRKIELYPK
jgi:predicted enzyme related to lactoylglutathione lyase